jgi:hypothetical protein
VGVTRIGFISAQRRFHRLAARDRDSTPGSGVAADVSFVRFHAAALYLANLCRGGATLNPSLVPYVFTPMAGAASTAPPTAARRSSPSTRPRPPILPVATRMPRASLARSLRPGERSPGPAPEPRGPFWLASLRDVAARDDAAQERSRPAFVNVSPVHAHLLPPDKRPA